MNYICGLEKIMLIMTKHQKTENSTNFEDIGSTLSKTEQYIEKNKKLLSIIVGGIVIVVLGYIGYNKLYIAPMETDAKAQMFMAESYFEKDSFNLALNGDGQYLGFLDIIEEFGPSKSGKLANYYAGLCYLHTGDFESAVEYLNNYSGKDEVLNSMKSGALGDANWELGKESEALNYYLEAANDYPNTFSSPIYLMKAGAIYEKQSNWDKALEVYETVKVKYFSSNEGRKIEKNIARVKALQGK